MAHSVVYYQAWERWLLCNDIIPKPIPLSHLAQCPELAEHSNTKNSLSMQELADFDTHVTAPHTHEGQVHVAGINCC